MKEVRIFYKWHVVIIFLLTVFLGGNLWAKFPEEDDIEYRDYLIAILETIPESNEQIHQLMIQFLRDKLKQNFETDDDTVIGANIVAIEVIKRALTEDFNTPPGNIPSEGGYEQREYLDMLIALTEKTPEELQNTYHINLGRLDVEKTTRIRENILTLQSFMRDDEEFEKKPVDTDALINTNHHPFFFYKDEWRQYMDKSFYAANHYNLKKGVFREDVDRDRTRLMINEVSSTNKEDPDNLYGVLQEQMEKFLTLDEHLVKGHQFFQKGKYAFAEEEYSQAVETVFSIFETIVISSREDEGFPSEIQHNLINTHFFIAVIERDATVLSKIYDRYNGKEDIRVKNPTDLQEFEKLNTVSCSRDLVRSGDYIALGDDLLSLIPHVIFFLLPVCLGDLYTATGDYQKAAYYYALCFPEHLLRASFEKISPPEKYWHNQSEPYKGYLPWNWSTDGQPASYKTKDDHYQVKGCELIPDGYPYLNKDCDIPFMRIRVCKLYLDWAEKLYRSNGETERYRARELYKAVLKEHGVWDHLDIFLSNYDNHNRKTRKNIRPLKEDVLLANNIIDLSGWGGSVTGPHKPQEAESGIDDLLQADDFLKFDDVTVLDDIIDISGTGHINPIIRSQIMEALLYFKQIDTGLNFFGFSYNTVPTLRYEVLMESAKYYADLAKQAEDDYIMYTEKEEKEEIELMNIRHAIDVASIRINIENQRVFKAVKEIKIAEIQVQQVKDVIAKKEKELRKKSSFFGQAKSYFKSMASFVKSVPGSATKSVGKDFLSEFKGTGTGGAGVLGGMAVFGVASMIAIKGIVDEGNNLRNQINKLYTQVLPMAEAALKSKKNDLNIAQLQKNIALLEEEFLKELYRYQNLKILNAETWKWMADMVQKSMQRYLDLGAMTGWLAQRALSFEQNRNITIMSLNYYNPENYGLMSSEELRGDLANLEKEYLVGFKNIIPIKWSISLSRDYPLAFAQLISTGRCLFSTDAKDLKRAFPGSYLHRIKAVNVTVISPVTEASYVGTIGNSGISYIDDKVLIRSPEALPISEFVLEKDMALYGLPGKALMTFEGNGINTIWDIQLPPDANPNGLSTIADVIVTFDLYTQFSAVEEMETLEQEPEGRSRLSLISFKQSHVDGFNSFINSDTNTILFSINDDYFSPFENQEKVINIYVMFIGEDLPEISGTIKNDFDPTGVTFTTEDGLIHSTHLLEQSSFMDDDLTSTLDQLDLGIPQQDWIITIPGNENPSLERDMIKDIILGIEYEATVIRE